MDIPITKNRMESGGDVWRIGVGGKLILEGTLVGGPAYPGDYPGKVYFVNNVTGLAANDGLSWETPMDEVSTAIAAAEAFRVLEAANNRYVRNVIYVQGTGVAYAALTALPNYCDIVGVGANPNGNGTGIAMIGADGADGIAGTARGLGLYNLQFISGGAFWCADFVSLFRSNIENCAFQTKDHASDGGIRFSDSSGGVTIRNCHWEGSGNVIAKVGIQVQGANFNDCKIEACDIHGTTAGVLVDNTCSTGSNGTAADNTVFKNNVIGDLGRGCVTAIDDNELAGMISYVGNYVMGTNLICCANNGAARVHGNLSANGFVAVTAS